MPPGPASVKAVSALPHRTIDPNEVERLARDAPFRQILRSREELPLLVALA